MEEASNMEILCRRSTTDDAIPVKLIIGDDYSAYEQLYGNYCIPQIIETSYFSVTATNADGDMLGFAAFSDFPCLTPQIPSDTWINFVYLHYKTENIHANNTLWLVFFAAKPEVADDVINNIFATLYSTLPDTDHVLFALYREAGPVSPISDYFSALPERAPTDVFQGDVLWSPREHVIPDLVIRKGKVEDYDDLMPLLLAEVGVLTEMGDDFYLEELLEHQDAVHCVLVAEDAETGEIVGLMCMSSSLDDQQYFVKHFNTEPYQKLKRWHQRHEKDQAHGNKNSFQIDFFYLNVEYECRATDFLRPAFKEFPFAEYAYIRLPHSIPDHALLSKFQYVPLKQGLTLKQGCFVVCRYILDDLEVRKAQPDDVARLAHLLSAQTELSKGRADETVAHAQLCASEAGPPGEAVISLLHKGNVIGTLHVQEMGDEETFQFVAEFAVDSKIDFLAANRHSHREYEEIGLEPRASPSKRTDSLPGLLVKYFYIKPIFRPHTRMFLRESLRLLRKEVLYYSVSLEEEVYNALQAELTLAIPRRQMHVPGQPMAPEAEPEDLVTLHFTSRRLLSEFKTKIHSRIVVIGASCTGLSFIYTLLALPYIHFSNIVLISRDGVPDHPNVSDHTWFADTLSFLEREYMLFRLPCKVRIIEGNLVDFERTEKYVVTDNGYVEPYDHLVITAGRQYTVPKELSPPKYLARNGVFPLGSKLMIDKLMQHVRESEIYEDDLSHCVIYGSSLDSFCTLTALLQLGVKASRLALVSPKVTDMDAEGVFRDPAVELKVDKLCEAMGMKFYKNHELERMEYNDDNTLTGIYIVNQSQPTSEDGEAAQKGRRSVELPCTMFIYCYEKDIDPAILSALNKRSIVFDGRVIVENNYRTTDKQIYAAGPIAMFSRRFGPSQPFETFSSMEVGRHLCHTVLAFLGVEEFKANIEEEEEEKDGIDREQLRKERRGQLFSDEAAQLAQDKGLKDEVIERPKPLPQYKDNMMWCVLLPNDYHYFHCQTYDCKSESVKLANNISTEDDNGDSYVRVSVNTTQYIQSISYLGSNRIEVHNFKVLVGLPQTYLNIVQRWDDGLITDVLGFLRQHWTMAVYYDKYQGFIENLKGKFRRQRDIQMLSEYILEHVQAENVDQIDESRRKRYGVEVTAETQQMVQLELIKFLHQNKEFLPIYFLPDVSSYIL
uniref:Cilia- and flagella-associated protein 61 N-terminal domain-containing protein n=1 Tax=Eutreptiella gymnastica TaxID=73025 RepID=A0A7S4G2C3_9EUGL